MQNFNLVSEYTAENSVRTNVFVSTNNGEIMRQATVLLRLIDSMGEGSGKAYVDLLGRVASRLSNCLGIFELCRRNDEADFRASCSEFETALGDREVLNVRRQVEDIGDEEFSLKMAVAEWSIDHYGSRKRELEGGMKAMNRLKDEFENGFLEILSKVSEGNYRRVRDLGLDQTLNDVVIGSLGRLVEKLG